MIRTAVLLLYIGVCTWNDMWVIIFVYFYQVYILYTTESENQFGVWWCNVDGGSVSVSHREKRGQTEPDRSTDR